MAVPERTHQAGTFFITAVCAERRRIFQVEANAQLMWDHLQQNRSRAYLLHAFVIMPEHIHLLLTPVQSLEHAMQMIKGGFHATTGLRQAVEPTSGSVALRTIVLEIAKTTLCDESISRTIQLLGACARRQQNTAGRPHTKLTSGAKAGSRVGAVRHS